jgi:hypothetical protein
MNRAMSVAVVVIDPAGGIPTYSKSPSRYRPLRVVYPLESVPSIESGTGWSNVLWFIPSGSKISVSTQSPNEDPAVEAAM